MDVKGTTKIKLLEGVTNYPPLAAQSGQREKVVSTNDSAEVSVELVPTSSQAQVARNEINRVITNVNLVSDATESIGKLVKGITGIVEQITQQKLPPDGANILENEANLLANAIRNTFDESNYEGVRPILGDKIRTEIEQRLGKTLEVLFPNEGQNSFSLERISLSRRDAIIATQANVAVAQERLEELKKSVEETSYRMHELVSAFEVAAQNFEARDSSVRDIDNALNLAHQASIGIGTNPKIAINSVGRLFTGVENLLE